MNAGDHDPIPGAERSSSEVPVARVRGLPVDELPHDLYIPPDALEVVLETFEGPLDLLLYLIKRQNLDILDIPVARITEQYLLYIDLMQGLRLDLAAEYLLMAAMLAEIKSRMLLPRPEAGVEEEDPRAELVRRLQEYERYKRGAELIDRLPRLERDVFLAAVGFAERCLERPEPAVSLEALHTAFAEVLARARMFTHHHILREPLSVRERMVRVLELAGGGFVEFSRLFSVEEGRRGVVVSLLAILELLKESLIEIVQQDGPSPIYVRALS
ncbi:MAG: segregation and condensation protein A [Gammaproteobacteria bacterium]